MKPHKHAELIKAWADGAIIEVKNLYGDWVEDATPNWTWNEYRIKPEPKPDTFLYLCGDIDGEWGEYGEIPEKDNSWKIVKIIKTIYDGETGELKDAEVLK